MSTATGRVQKAVSAGSGTRYLGSKARLSEEILNLIGEPTAGGVFVDGFTGTGSIARAAAIRGWPVRLNDFLYSATVMAGAAVTSQAQASFLSFGGYGRALEILNTTPAELGFVWREYSPASAGRADRPRRYFTEENASRIDAVRKRIGEWYDAGRIGEVEERVLLADLLAAANRVANTSGTYGCFLRNWSANALRPLMLEERMLLPEITAVEVSNCEVGHVRIEASDVVYYDPPYTKRQYAAYYHLLETIAHGDAPEVTGITGLRPWRHKASDFCHKSRALGAISDLLARTPARRIYLSYSADGHVPLADLSRECAKTGRVTVHSLREVGRYRPNEGSARMAATVSEYLLEIVRPTATEAVQ